MSKIACVYHSIDLDGWMSAAIVQHWFMVDCKERYDQTKFMFYDGIIVANFDVITFIGYNNGEVVPDLTEYDKVIMCDISFPYINMQILAEKGINFIWIDHHISTIKENKDLLIHGDRSTKYAACELTWMYFFPSIDSKSLNDEPYIPEIVKLLGKWDNMVNNPILNENEWLKVTEFQYGARSCITNYRQAYINLLKPIENTNNILGLGSAIYSNLCTEANHAYKNRFEIELFEEIHTDNGSSHLLGRSFICINKERFNPINFGINYHEDGYDGAACFWYDGKVWRFSLYNDNGLVDCSVIAKQFGGGGHKGASGFITDNIESIINN